MHLYFLADDGLRLITVVLSRRRDARVSPAPCPDEGRGGAGGDPGGAWSVMVHSRGVGSGSVEERLRVMGEVWSQGWAAYTMPFEATLEQVPCYRQREGA